MIIWIAVVLPLVTTGVLFVIFNHKVTWWELGIQIVVPFLLTLGAKSCAESSQTQATEYWGSYVASAAYCEPWNEKVSCRHDIPCAHPEYSKDSDGRRYQSGYKHFNDGYYHAFDVDEHGPDWTLYTSAGGSINVSEGTFANLCTQFGNKVFVNLNRHYYTRNGNKYSTEWKGEWEKLEPLTTIHTYENRVQATHNVFNFAKVDPKDFGLYEHPGISSYRQQCVLGDAGPDHLGAKKIEYLNAVLGSSRQVRLYVLIFKNQSIQAGLDQEAYWKAGNKNEFTTCIGVDDEYNVQWCHVFSWTEVDILKIEARSFITDQKTLDVMAYANWLAKEIPEKWQRKNFKDFSYITVDPPFSAVVWTFVITLLVSLGMGVFAVLNPFDAEREQVSVFGCILRFHIKKRKAGDL